jgi:hypothetical protein
MGEVGWKNPQVAEWKHNNFLAGSDYQTFSKWIMTDYERVSINCISWLGGDMGVTVGRDEEQWLSVDRPKELKRYNAICGSAVCVHYAFYTQREHLNKTNILEQYKEKLKKG